MYSEQRCRPAPVPLPLYIKYCAVLYRVGARETTDRTSSRNKVSLGVREKRFNVRAIGT